MAPKALAGNASRPQHSRKASAANAATGGEKVKKTKDTKEKDKTKDMPPPPPKPMAVLEPEIKALEDSLKNVIVSTAQIFKFHSDIKKLGVQRNVPNPPRTMTLSLEYELKRYDQICDTLDSQLGQAVAVLQRDLEREEREAEAEKARAKAAEPPQVDTDIEMGPPPDVPPSTDLRSSPPSGAITGAGRAPFRRPSAVSLSTLHRNPFPLKLDLSSSALRAGTDDNGQLSSLADINTLGNIGSLADISGLASPVTLAPKSARAMGPGELPPDVLAALASAAPDPQNIQGPQPQQHQHIPSTSTIQNVDIDLTLDDHLSAGMNLLSAGSSADKPIELDLDLDVQMSEIASDVFGDQSSSGMAQEADQPVTDLESLFSPGAGQTDLPGGESTEGMDMSIINALSENPDQTDAFLASLGTENNSAGAARVDAGSQDNAANSIEGGQGPNDTGFDFSSLDMSNMSDLFGSTGNGNVDDLQKLLGMDQTAPEAGPSREGNNNAARQLQDERTSSHM